MSLYPLTALQARIVELSDALAGELAPAAASHDREGSFAPENLERLHRAGFLRLAIPREFGGEGADVFDMTLALEHLAKGDAGSALVVGMMLNVLGRQRDDLVWPAHVYERICRDIAENGGGINTCATESDLGSISRGGAPAATATPTDGGFLVNGKKIFVTGAPALSYFVTLVQLPPSPRAPHGEVASAIVAAHSPGLHLQEAWQGALSLRTCGNFDVTYRDVYVPEDFVVERRPLPGPVAPGAKPPQGKGAPGLGPWSLTIAAVYLGIGEGALDAAIAYANARVPSALGRPIADTPHIQERIGTMAVGLTAARAQLHETARLWRDHPELRDRLPASIAAAKYLCTSAACAATETGLRVAGGFSLTAELSLERYFRDARAGLFQPPQDDLALGFIGRDALASARVTRDQRGQAA